MSQDSPTIAATNDPAPAYIADINGKNYAVDPENNRIQFLDSRFYRTKDGGFVPSVTTILEAYPKGAQYAEWLKKHGEDADEIRDEAGRRGSVVHGMTEALDYGGELTLMNEDGSPKYKLSEWGMLGRYAEFRERHPATIHAIELNMISAELGYAGTLDRVLTMDGQPYLMDIKTSGAVHNSYWLQQAAYIRLLGGTKEGKGAIGGIPVERVKPAILWLNAKTKTYGKDGSIQGPGWQFLTTDTPTDKLLRLFDHTHALWLEENGSAKPRTTTYKLTQTLKPKTP